MSYSRDAAKHIHRPPNGFRLVGARRVQICLPYSTELAGQLAAFVQIWDKAMAQLRGHKLSRLGRGVDVVFTERRGYYARFWRGHTLCINLPDLLKQGKDAPGIIIHELGHRVWFHIARQKTRARWAADHHARRKIDPRGDSFVSPYARTNALEDHAEAFRERLAGNLTGHAKTRYERIGPLTRTIRQRMRA